MIVFHLTKGTTLYVVVIALCR